MSLHRDYGADGRRVVDSKKKKDLKSLGQKQARNAEARVPGGLQQERVLRLPKVLSGRERTNKFEQVNLLP